MALSPHPRRRAPQHEPRALTPQDHANPHPIFVVWELTLHCDQACRHCGSRAGAARVSELDTVESLRIVEECAAMGVREIALIGGEAYLRDDWLQIASAIVSRGMRCTMVSGGRRLHRERVRALREAGVHSVSISVDGLRATHDDLRAVPGSFDAALAALEALRDEGVTHTVNTQINRRNCEELEALGEILFDLDVRAWQFQITTPMGRAADRARLVLQPWHLVEIFPRLAALAGRARTRNCRLVAANNIGYFGPHEGDLRPGGFWVGCPAGRFSLGIQSDGKVKGCASLPTAEWTDLSLRDLPLAHIYAESRALARLRERSREGLGGFCRDCYYAELCVGGCVWMTTTFFGSWGDNPYCHHRALELKGRGLRERVVPRVGSPGGAFDHGLWTVVREPWREQEEEEEKDPADDILMGMSRGVAQEGGGC